MTSADVEAAVSTTAQDGVIVCISLSAVLPVLRELAKGRVWWVRLGMVRLIKALEDYQRSRCGAV